MCHLFHARTLTDMQKGIQICNLILAQSVKNLPAMQETQVRFLGREDPLEEEMAIHSSIDPYHTLCCMLSHVQLFVAQWTVACKALLSMGFPRQQY